LAPFSLHSSLKGGRPVCTRAMAFLLSHDNIDQAVISHVRIAVWVRGHSVEEVNARFLAALRADDFKTAERLRRAHVFTPEVNARFCAIAKEWNPTHRYTAGMLETPDVTMWSTSLRPSALPFEDALEVLFTSHEVRRKVDTHVAIIKAYLREAVDHNDPVAYLGMTNALEWKAEFSREVRNKVLMDLLREYLARNENAKAAFVACNSFPHSEYGISFHDMTPDFINAMTPFILAMLINNCVIFPGELTSKFLMAVDPSDFDTVIQLVTDTLMLARVKTSPVEGFIAPSFLELVIADISRVKGVHGVTPVHVQKIRQAVLSKLRIVQGPFAGIFFSLGDAMIKEREFDIATMLWKKSGWTQLSWPLGDDNWNAEDKSVVKEYAQWFRHMGFPTEHIPKHVLALEAESGAAPPYIPVEEVDVLPPPPPPSNAEFDDQFMAAATAFVDVALAGDWLLAIRAMCTAKKLFHDNNKFRSLHVHLANAIATSIQAADIKRATMFALLGRTTAYFYGEISLVDHLIETAVGIRDEVLPAFRSLLTRTPETRLSASFLVQTFNQMDILPNVHAKFHVRLPHFSADFISQRRQLLPTLFAALIADDAHETTQTELAVLVHDIQSSVFFPSLGFEFKVLLTREFAAFAASERSNFARRRRMDVTLETVYGELFSDLMMPTLECMSFMINCTMWAGFLDSVYWFDGNRVRADQFPMEWAKNATSEEEQQAITTIAATARVEFRSTLSKRSDELLQNVHFGGLRSVFLDAVARSVIAAGGPHPPTQRDKRHRSSSRA
jgi:hypothetical protein